MPDDRKISVLFCCMGNICRSPTAEAVFRHAVTEAKLEHAFECDSAGTGGEAEHTGDPDRRRGLQQTFPDENPRA